MTHECSPNLLIYNYSLQVLEHLYVTYSSCMLVSDFEYHYLVLNNTDKEGGG